jgi:transposase-like protein
MKEKYKKVIELKSRGYTAIEVKDMLKSSFSPHHINRIYQWHLEGNLLESKWTEEKLRQVEDLKKTGKTLRVIAEIMGVTHEAVKCRLWQERAKASVIESQPVEIKPEKPMGLRAWCTANRKKPDYSRDVTIYA